MQLLAELKQEAQNNENKREFLIILPNGRPHNGRFLDPYLGLVELNEAKGQCISIRDLEPFKTQGIFID